MVVGVGQVVVRESNQEHRYNPGTVEIRSLATLSRKVGDMRWPRTLWVQRPIAAAVRVAPPPRCCPRWTTTVTALTACPGDFVSAVASPSATAEQEDEDSDSFDGCACAVG